MPATRITELLDREIHGLLTDVGVIAQRTDEFVDQEKLVRGFTAAWRKTIDTLEESVMQQIAKGKRKVKV